MPAVNVGLKPIALISVFDKTGVVELASELHKIGIKILSTGGTFRALVSAGIDVIEVSTYIQQPEIMNGRVKTLHPKVFGGILSRREDEGDLAQLEQYSIPNIDLVVVDLYPFEDKLSDVYSSEKILIENIDIGGPSMLRSAAKNYEHVTVLPSPKYYNKFIKLMSDNNGLIELGFRKKMANEAFNETAYYDSMISNWMNINNNNNFSDKKTTGGKMIHKLRYGENPHQESAVYEIPSVLEGFSKLEKLQGKALSHNNYLDSYAAYDLITDFEPNKPICAIIKHNNPCGCALDQDVKSAYLKALSGDPVSAFGGIVAFNNTIDKNIASELIKNFYEVILAPHITPDALHILSQKKNLRVLKYKTPKSKKIQNITFLQKTFLAQDENKKVLGLNDIKIVTKKIPTDQEVINLLFANKVCKHVKSNAIVIAKNSQTLGIGAGQTSRIGSSKIACNYANQFFKEDLKNSGAASDAFFPFADGLKELVSVGVRSIIQPGGSVKDKEVIDAADKAGISMIFTGTRNFKH